MLNKTRSSITPLLATLGILIAAFAWQAGAHSATATRPPATPTAIATVDVVTIFDQLQELQDLEADLDNRKSTRQSQLDEVNNQLKAITADLEVMNRGTDEYKDKVREAMEMQAVYKARSDALNQILSIDRGNMMRDLFTSVSDAISRVADREGYDVVLFDDSAFVVPENVPHQEVQRAIVTRSLIYRHNSIDITNQVIDLMNSEYSTP